MLPWVLDHVHMDVDTVRRWQGGDVDLSRRLPSDRILAATPMDERIGRPAPGTWGCSRCRRPSTRSSRWPTPSTCPAGDLRYSEGPNSDELVAIVDDAMRGASVSAPTAGSARS